MKTEPTLIIAIALLVGACNQVTDLQPEETIPQSAINAVREKFPNATNMVFKPLEKNRVWQVDFGQDAKKYESAVNQTEMLAAYLRIIDIPDSVEAYTNTTSVGGGEFTGNYRQPLNLDKGDVKFNVYITDYNWQGKPYTLEYSTFSLGGSNPNSASIFIKTVSLSDPYSFFYTSDKLTDLPERVQTFIQERGLTVKTVFIEEPIVVVVELDGRKTYFVKASKQSPSTAVGYGYFTLAFDNDGNYIYPDGVPSLSDSKGNTQYLEGATLKDTKNIDEVPASIRTNIQATPEFAGTTFLRMTESAVYGKRAYEVSLQKGPYDFWSATFGEQGQLIGKSYRYSRY